MLLARVSCVCVNCVALGGSDMSQAISFHSTETCRRSEFIQTHRRNVSLLQQGTRHACCLQQSHFLCNFCCLQQEAGSAMPTSSTCAPSVSDECSGTDRSATSEIRGAMRGACFISPVTRNHRHGFSMRVPWGVKTAVVPLVSKGTERWQGHSRSIRVLKRLCADGEP